MIVCELSQPVFSHSVSTKLAVTTQRTDATLVYLHCRSGNEIITVSKIIVQNACQVLKRNS